MTLKMVFAVKPLYIVRPKARLVHLGPTNPIKVEQNHTRIESRISVLYVFLTVFAVRLRLAGDCSWIIWFAKISGWIKRTELVEHVIVDGR